MYHNLCCLCSSLSKFHLFFVSLNSCVLSFILVVTPSVWWVIFILSFMVKFSKFPGQSWLWWDVWLSLWLQLQWMFQIHWHWSYLFWSTLSCIWSNWSVCSQKMNTWTLNDSLVFKSNPTSLQLHRFTEAML